MIRTALVCALGLFAVACGGDEEEETSIKPTYASIQKEIFNKSCTTSSCHGDAKAGNLELREGAAYDELFNVDPDNAAAAAAGMKLVAAGDIDKSFLYKKLTSPGSGEGSRMPVGAKLSSEKVNAVKTWIQNGASK